MNDLIRAVADSPDSSFYSDVWGTARDFSELPTVARADFQRVPLSKRRYKKEKGLVKIVHDERGAFLSEWSFRDIARERFGVVSDRPFVYMSDPHEAIEKSMWCYEQNMLPLIGEKDPVIATYAASRYRVDSLITDATALAALAPYLEHRTDPLEAITVVGAFFPLAELLPLRSYAKAVRLVLSFPETGAFAEAALDERPAFRAFDDCIVEKRETIIVSKIAHLVTPIIRFQTSVPTALYDGA